MLVTLKEILAPANDRGYAVPAFNINNLEICQAVMSAAIAENAPIILQTSEGAIEYAGLEYLSAIAHVAARANVPVVFHVDHGKKYDLVRALIASHEYSSAMYDGSSLPLEENIARTAELARLAHKNGMSLEAELGAIKGTEDNVSVSARAVFFTEPKDAERFVKETGCDALAISIGTAHGAYKFEGVTKLDFVRLAEIKKRVRIPLVLHGASNVPKKLVTLAEKYGARLGKACGVSDTALSKAVALGINKVNIDSDLRLAFVAGVHQAIELNPKNIDPRKILLPAKKLMTELARHKMRLCGASGKA